jgi:hypothetical protein
MEGMPQLPGVKDLTIYFSSKGSHSLGATVASLIALCGNLEYLHLDNQSHVHVSISSYVVYMSTFFSFQYGRVNILTSLICMYFSLLNRIYRYKMKYYHTPCGEGCGDCDLRGSWKDDVLSLEHLRKVKLGSFSGQEHYCLDMARLLLASAPVLESITVTAKTSIEPWCDDQELMLVESLESSLPRGRGKWTARRAANATVTLEYEWTQGA